MLCVAKNLWRRNHPDHPFPFTLLPATIDGFRYKCMNFTLCYRLGPMSSKFLMRRLLLLVRSLWELYEWPWSAGRPAIGPGIGETRVPLGSNSGKCEDRRVGPPPILTLEEGWESGGGWVGQGQAALKDNFGDLWGCKWKILGRGSWVLLKLHLSKLTNVFVQSD